MESVAYDTFEVAHRKSLAGGYAVVRAVRSGFDAEPGQFVMVRGDWGVSPFLPRPFSLASAGDGEAMLLIRVVGDGTRRLAAVQREDELSVNGPLGRPFGPVAKGERLLLVGGGVGIAPLLFLARRAARAGAGAVEVLYGGRTRRDLPLAPDIAAAATGATFTTEDGSAGERGLVTDAAARRIDRAAFDRVVACGPWAMMAAIAGLAAAAGLHCETSLEAMMACGFGVCLGCAVPAAGGGYLYACSDGPAVDAGLVDWDAGDPGLPSAASRTQAGPKRAPRCAAGERDK